MSVDAISPNPFHTSLGLTCQICGRRCQAKEGYIANHGYQRYAGEDGLGCDGSRHEPWENSRALVGGQIAIWNTRASDHIRFAVEAGETVHHGGEPNAHIVTYHCYHSTESIAQRDSWKAKYDSWVQTITDEQWNANRVEVVYPKRSKATVEGWETRLRTAAWIRGLSADRDAEHKAREDEPVPNTVDSPEDECVLYSSKTHYLNVVTEADGCTTYGWQRMFEDFDEEILEVVDDPADFTAKMPVKAKRAAMKHFKARNADDRNAEHDAEHVERQPDPPPEHRSAWQTATLVEHGVKVAMFQIMPTGRIHESIPMPRGEDGGFEMWEGIDIHEDLSTLPPEIATQFAGAL